jgi:two-component system sensor histidine kinase BaeS
MRLRLILSFVLIVVITVISVVLIARLGTENEVRSFMFPGGMASAEALVSELEQYYKSNLSWEGVENILNTSIHRQGRGQGAMVQGMMNQRIRLADAQGQVIYDSLDSEPNEQLSSADLQRALPVDYNRQAVGYLLLEGGMGFTQSDQRFLVERLTNSAIIAGVIAGVLALALAMLLAYRLLQPVRDLTEAAEKLAQGDLTQRVRVRDEDEIGTLGRTFNQMASSLEQAGESRRAMTADIAHELRTPLAVQRAHLEALQDGIYSMNAQNLEPILEQNQQLTRLVEDLRTLALADAGRLELVRVPTNFTRLIPRVVERFAPQADSRGIQLQVATPQECPELKVDPGRIEQILANLISNSLRHTPEKGVIDIRVTCGKDSVEVRVRDSGSGIPEDALPFVFDRFYRADRSRSRTEGGTGLGLAIARQLTQAHGGQLSAANHPQGGSVFTINLPIDLTKPS